MIKSKIYLICSMLTLFAAFCSACSKTLERSGGGNLPEESNAGSIEISDTGVFPNNQFTHLGWWYDEKITIQIIQELKRRDIKYVIESGLSISIWVETDDLQISKQMIEDSQTWRETQIKEFDSQPNHDDNDINRRDPNFNPLE